MTSNTFSETAFNVMRSASSPAQILTQMQTCIEQLEEQCWQQNLKINKSDQFDETKKKLRQWLIQMNVHMSAQFYQLEMKKDKVMLAISYLTDKAADWIQFYINKKFHLENLKNKEDKMFDDYNKFVNKITAAFESMNFKREIEWKLKYLKQKESVFIYAADFRQIIFILDWNDEVYVLLFYQELKDRVKNELAKIKWSDDLDDIIKIVIQIDNCL